MHKDMPAWVGITYLIYILSLEALIWVGGFYLILVHNFNLWWVVLMVFMSAACYRPGRWAEMVTGDTGVDGVDGKGD